MDIININNKNGNLEFITLKLLFNYNVFKKYVNYLKEEFLSNETEKIWNTIRLFHEKYPDKGISSAADLEIFFYTLYPATNQKERLVYGILFQRIQEQTPDASVGEDYFKSLKRRFEGHRIMLMAHEVGEGQLDWQSLSQAVLEAPRAIDEGLVEAQSPFVSNRLSELYEAESKVPGLRWRLKTLNRMVGSIRKGNLVIVFARPETGKTTFLSSEATFMAANLKKDSPPIIWFNNEQAGIDVQNYLYRAYLGLTKEELHGKLKENEKKYIDGIGDKILQVDNGAIYKKDVEAIIRQYGASLIIFDQLPKIKGFQQDREDLKLGSIFQWARELSKATCPVIGVCQAGDSGSNKRYLDMEDIVNSNTAIQAEADVLLGIGALQQEGYAHLRHFHVSKNKLAGDADTDPKLRHGKMDVIIRPEISRYEDCPE